MVVKLIVIFEIMVLALAMMKIKPTTLNKKRDITYADTEGKEND